jgi:uncharacterized damage-inducible protein DinB
MPAAHSFQQSVEDLDGTGASELSADELWRSVGGAAAVGFHLKHLAGATDRLLTYARGAGLTEDQLAFLAAEREPDGRTAAELVTAAQAVLRRAIAQVRSTTSSAARDERRVGRAGLPATVHGLLFHAAEHAYRHAAQVATTVKVVRGSPRPGDR